MKDRISFENSIREKSKRLIAHNKRKKKIMLGTLSALCVCFVVTLGVGSSFGGFLANGGVSFDAALSPKSEAEAADGGYYGDFDAMQNETIKGATDASDSLFEERDEELKGSGQTQNEGKLIAAQIYSSTLASYTKDENDLLFLLELMKLGDFKDQKSEQYCVQVTLIYSAPDGEDKRAVYITEEAADKILP
jgi:hypothetical protein